MRCNDVPPWSITPGMQTLFHVTGRLALRDVSLWDEEIASWCWDALRRAFPEALASALMPDHPHSVTRLPSAEVGEARLNRWFAALARRLGTRMRVGIAAPPQPIVGRAKLSRQLRYVVLNAPREGLALDPLEPVWSTHRDVMGAVVDPWVDAERLARALSVPLVGFRERWHAYVSGDPSVHVNGTPSPVPAQPCTVARIPLQTIVIAATTACRAPLEAIRSKGPARMLLVQLASEQGWRSSSQLADLCGCTPRTIRRLREQPGTGLLEPGRLCLGDPRLLPRSGHSSPLAAVRIAQRPLFG
jgi:hypothetical protein